MPSSSSSFIAYNIEFAESAAQFMHLTDCHKFSFRFARGGAYLKYFEVFFVSDERNLSPKFLHGQWHIVRQKSEAR